MDKTIEELLKEAIEITEKQEALLQEMLDKLENMTGL